MVNVPVLAEFQLPRFIHSRPLDRPKQSSKKARRQGFPAFLERSAELFGQRPSVDGDADHSLEIDLAL